MTVAIDQEYAQAGYLKINLVGNATAAGLVGQVLNPEGLFVNFIGAWGVEEGEFFRPKGVALDRHNRVYVSDSYLGVIQVFDANGNFYAALGDPRTKKVKKFKTPVGLFIDHLNRLYVVEMRANKVSVFRLE